MTPSYTAKKDLTFDVSNVVLFGFDAKASFQRLQGHCLSWSCSSATSTSACGSAYQGLLERSFTRFGLDDGS